MTLLLLYWFKPCGPIQKVDFYFRHSRDRIRFSSSDPLPISLLFIGLALYIKRTKLFYSLAFGIYLLLFIWLISNSIYYRGIYRLRNGQYHVGFSKVSAGLGAALELFRPWECDLHSRFPYSPFFFKWIRMDNRPASINSSLKLPLYRLCSFRPTFLGDRPELLTRGFSNYYRFVP